VFNTDPDHCEEYGHDFETGADEGEQAYRAKQPGGRAFLLPAEYRPAPEVPGDEYPLALTTGRTLTQFHTRTKTGRAPELNAAAPHVWVELHPDDAAKLGVADGEPVTVESPRGAIRAPVRLTGVRPGTVFVPFHYAEQAANELTRTGWDPVSKQPHLKLAAVRVRRGEEA